MDKNYKLFLTLGIVILIVPFLGFPEVVGSVILFIIGVILIVVSLMYRTHFSMSFDDSHDERSETIYVDSNVQVVKEKKKRGRKPKKKVVDEEQFQDADQDQEVEIELSKDQDIEIKVERDEEDDYGNDRKNEE